MTLVLTARKSTTKARHQSDTTILWEQDDIMLPDVNLPRMLIKPAMTRLVITKCISDGHICSVAVTAFQSIISVQYNYCCRMNFFILPFLSGIFILEFEIIAQPLCIFGRFLRFFAFILFFSFLPNCQFVKLCICWAERPEEIQEVIEIAISAASTQERQRKFVRVGNNHSRCANRFWS